MPWQARLRREVAIPIVFLTASAFVAVSCVTVAQEPGGVKVAFPPETPATVASAAPAARQLAKPIPTPSPRPTPSVSTALAPLAAATVRPTASPAATPSPTSTPAPTPTPVATAAMALAPSTVPPSPEVASAVAGTGAELDRATRRKLRLILANQVENKGVAGLQAAVRTASSETWLGTAGMAEFAPDRAIDDDTVFSIASVTKTFVAALILQLVDEGKIDLDVPFGTYFKDAPRQRHATVRQLLSHTSGIYNFFENPRYWDGVARAWLRAAPTGLNSREHQWTYDEIMGLVKNRGYCKVGKCYHYSNTNFVILGQIAEAVEGKPLHKQLRQRFFDPLGMEDTVYQPEERPGPNAAHGHWANVGGGYNDHTRGSPLVPFMAAASVADAAGAIASTANDLSIWAEALYGGQLLSEDSLRQMTTFLQPGTYGLGTDVAVFAGHRGHGHRGGLRGFESSMWYFPESGVSIVLLSNQGNWLTDVPMQKLVKTVLG